MDAIGPIEIDLETCSGYSMEERLNVLPDGLLGDAVCERIEYCEWHTGPLPSLSLNAEPGDYQTIGETLTVTVDMADQTQVIEGGQFFLKYDTAKLDFIEITPGDSPFSIVLWSEVEEETGTINYVVTSLPARAPLMIRRWR